LAQGFTKEDKTDKPNAENSNFNKVIRHRGKTSENLLNSSKAQKMMFDDDIDNE